MFSKNLKSLLEGFKKNRLSVSFGFVFFVLGLTSAYLAGRFLDKNYPNPGRPADLILDNLEEIKAFVLIAEITSTTVSFFIIHKALSSKFKEFGEYFTKIGILYILRSISIVVTPLAQIQDAATNGSNPVLASLFYKGMFFSGHTGLAFLVFFLEKENKKLKFFKLVIAVITAVAVILSHSHYTIDVIGGFLAAYFVANLNVSFINKKPLKLTNDK